MPLLDRDDGVTSPTASPRLRARGLLDRVAALRDLGRRGAGDRRPCATCGHLRLQHVHLRAGTDCSAPDCTCPRFRRGAVTGR